MTTEADVARARQIAIFAHSNQTDHAGVPYIAHVAAVANAVRAAGGTLAQIAIAWLHDVVEDTFWTLDMLIRNGFDTDVVDGVDAITRRDGEQPDPYYKRVKTNPNALFVKERDIDNNADPERIAVLAKTDPKKAERLTGKYAKARKALGIRT